MEIERHPEGFTRRVAEEVVGFRYGDLTPETREYARHAVLDWLGTTIAGSAEPSGRIARAVALDSECRPVSTVIGTTCRTSPREATLANGVAAHALDFDDTSALAGGHVSAPVISAAVALGEARGATWAEVIEAIVAGIQGQARIAVATGESPYEKGFHCTGTFGTFGAAG